MSGRSFCFSKKAKTSKNAVFADGAEDGSPHPKNLTIFKEPNEPTRYCYHRYLKPARLPLRRTLHFCLFAVRKQTHLNLCAPFPIKNSLFYGSPFLVAECHPQFFPLVRKMGVEPTRYCYHRYLKPARLPFRHFRKEKCNFLHFDFSILYLFSLAVKKFRKL